MPHVTDGILFPRPARRPQVARTKADVRRVPSRRCPRAIAFAAGLVALLQAPAFFAHGRTLEFEVGVAAIEACDYPRAVAPLRAAALHGDARAQRVLGLMLLWGPTLYPGVHADPAEALMWLQHASDQGDEQARWLVKRMWN